MFIPALFAFSCSPVSGGDQDNPKPSDPINCEFSDTSLSASSRRVWRVRTRLNPTFAIILPLSTMSDENSPQPTPISSSSSTRRASFSPGQKISELFGRSPTNNGNGPPFYPSPITTAAANVQAQQRRRMSITSLGLSASPTQSAFAGYRARQDSLSSVTSPSASIDECAIEDGDAATHESPSSPFARRMSFGARALRDVKAGTGNLGGRNSLHLLTLSSSVKRRGLLTPCKMVQIETSG